MMRAEDRAALAAAAAIALAAALGYEASTWRTSAANGTLFVASQTGQTAVQVQCLGPTPLPLGHLSNYFASWWRYRLVVPAVRGWTCSASVRWR